MAIERKNGIICVDGVPIIDIANKLGTTPFYVYSKDALLAKIREWKKALEGTNAILAFSLKSNNNFYLNRVIAGEGLGAITVSGWEIELAQRAGFNLKKSLLHGNGKQKWEVAKAINLGMLISVDSCFDAEQIKELAEELKLPVSVLLRINPQIDPHVHPYVATSLAESKFGFTGKDLNNIISKLKESRFIEIVGLHSHLGSSIQSVAPMADSLRYLIKLAEKLVDADVSVQIIDVGGGLGINYFHDDTILPSPEDYVSTLRQILEGLDYTLMLEPGRAIIAECGILVGKVLGTKENGGKSFLVTDASMTELIRPPLYDAYHHIELVSSNSANDEMELYDIVGPVCESADFLGKNRKLPKPNTGELIAIFDAGAYGYTMSSNYNLRPQPAEIVVDNTKVVLTRKRSEFEDIFNRYSEETLI